MNNMDAAIILKENGELELELPNIPNETHTPNNVMIITAMGIMIAENDQRFASVINQKIKEMNEVTIN